MIDDGSPLSLSGIKAAAAAGRLPALARKLVAERRWSSLNVLIGAAATPALALKDSAPGMIALCEELSGLPAVDQKEAHAELFEVQLQAAVALAHVADKSPLTDVDRTGLAAAAALFAVAHEHNRAALLYERAGDDEMAAEIWGALGELERMEGALSRLAERQAQVRQRRDARAQFESLLAAGERGAAVEFCLRLVAAARATDGPPDIDLQQLGLRARRLSEQLCRGRAVTLRLATGRLLRVADVPAVLGRDRDAALPVREPTVSRQHACIRASGDALTLEDTHSRTGTRLEGFALGAAVPLHGTGTIELGANCRMRYATRQQNCIELQGDTGLDRGFWALVGQAPIDLAPLLGLPTSLFLAFSSGVARLQRPPSMLVRVGGKLVGPGCDLLVGDVIEIAGAPSWEVV